MRMHCLHKLVTAGAVSTVFAASPCAMAQGVTGDPFLDAMIKSSTPASTRQYPETPEKPATPSNEAPKDQPAPQIKPQLIDTSSDTKLVNSDQVMKELGESTGLGIMNAAAGYDGLTVNSVNIQYVSGKRTVPDQRLLDVIQTSPGSKYSTTRINDDLERLLKKGLVDSNARVAVSRQGSGVNVTFEVVPANVMGGVGFTGNHNITAKELREVTKLTSSKVINDHDLAIARAEIIKLYQKKGYPDARVTWRHSKTAREGYDDVIFDITEGRRVRMRHIYFTGNRQFDSQQLRQLMETKEYNILSWITDDGNVDREKLDDDLQAIIRQYRNYGYLRAKIDKVEYSERKKTGPQDLTMRVHLTEGPRYRVRHVTFKGNKVYTARELRPGISMLDGDIYSLQKVSDDSRMIRDYYGAKGYADAMVRPDINEVGIEKNGIHLIDICYEINEGKRYAVGRINVRGNTRTKQHVILRELPFQPGQNLNSVDLETAKKRLENLGYFGGVDVSPAASNAPGYRDINITVNEKQTGNMTIGAAVSSIESVYLYANVTQSNFDIRGLFGRGSLTGGGERLAISGKLGWEYQSASISLVEPWFLNRKLAFGNEAYFSNSSYMSDYYVQKNYGYAVSLLKALDDKNSVKIEYRIERYDINAQGGAPAYFQFCDGKYNRSNFRLTFEHDTRDAMITPRKGGNLEAYASYSGPGSTIRTYGAGLSGSVYYNSFWDTIFSLNFGMDTVQAVDKNRMVPIFERCYLGGPGNLRGFRFHDVGMIIPELTGDETMGGNSSAFVQAEVTIPILETVRFAIFIDAGFVHEDSFDFSLNEIAADYGVGLRINLPMGPLAVDYAIPIRKSNAVDRSGQFQFYVDYKY